MRGMCSCLGATCDYRAHEGSGGGMWRASPFAEREGGHPLLSTRRSGYRYLIFANPPFDKQPRPQARK